MKTETQRVIFVGVIMLIAVLCMIKMNMNYNRLSRYQYIDYMSEDEQDLVRSNLDDKEIEYIIEWSISPDLFISFVNEPRFSIYHIQVYNDLQFMHPYLSPKQIVEVTETAGLANEVPNYTFDEISDYLVNYDYEAVMDWIENKDQYNPSSILVTYARNTDTILTDVYTIGKRTPSELIRITSVPVLDDKREVYILNKMVEPLENLCQAIVDDRVSSRTCGGLVVSTGYISYPEQETIYKEALKEYGDETLMYVDYPGHSEHQLGLAVDFAVSGLKSDNFSKTKQYDWLVENAWKYGFIQSYPLEFEEKTGKYARLNHWRFVGIEEAKAIVDQGLSIMDCVQK